MLPYIRLSQGVMSCPEWAAPSPPEDLPSGVFTIDDAAPIVRRRPDGSCETRVARWGMPSPGRDVRTRAIHRAYRAYQHQGALTNEELEDLAANEPDSGTPFIDASSQFWRPSLEPQGRCVVPFTAFGALEIDSSKSPRSEYLFPPAAPLGFMAGVYETGWQGVRRPELGRETVDLFGLVSVERIVQSDLYKRTFTPIILADAAEVDTWLSAPWAKAKTLRRKPVSELVE